MLRGIANILIVIGALSVFFAGVLLCYFIYDEVSAWYEGVKWAYKYKHRFDKEPIAPCYCKDCMNYSPYDWNNGREGTCSLYRGLQRTLSDNMFCCLAEPMHKDPDSLKHK